MPDEQDDSDLDATEPASEPVPPPDEPPPDCVDDKCNHGRCDDGKCKCKEGWDGDSCNLKKPQPDCTRDDDCKEGRCSGGQCKCNEGLCDEKATLPDEPPPDCANDDECNHGRCDDGKCKCKEGWDGNTCTVERCGDIDGGCGKHGKCHHDECECQDGWKGDHCDDKITYSVKIIATSVNSRSRSAEACGDDLYELMDRLDDESKHDKLYLDTVTTIELPSECGNFDLDTTRSMVRQIVDYDHEHHHHHDDEPILIMLVFDESSKKTVDDYTCVENMEDAANKIANHMKPMHLKELDGSIVYMDYEECGDEEEIEYILHEEVD